MDPSSDGESARRVQAISDTLLKENAMLKNALREIVRLIDESEKEGV